MVQPIEHGLRGELPIAGRRFQWLWSLRLTRDAVIDPMMGPGGVEIRCVLFHDPVQVTFVLKSTFPPATGPVCAGISHV